MAGRRRLGRPTQPPGRRTREPSTRVHCSIKLSSSEVHHHVSAGSHEDTRREDKKTQGRWQDMESSHVSFLQPDCVLRTRQAKMSHPENIGDRAIVRTSRELHGIEIWQQRPDLQRATLAPGSWVVAACCEALFQRFRVALHPATMRSVGRSFRASSVRPAHQCAHQCDDGIRLVECGTRMLVRNSRCGCIMRPMPTRITSTRIVYSGL
mmetsp:Transcript_2937/g.7618  ORF Transcript_2937/g.7618 Transcript_2937/m.7618 type:complete len:209 (+) Transcript_2937:291-917(+)